MADRAAKTFDPEREITTRIVAAIEAGTPPWRKPWTGGGGCPFPLRHTGEAYRGINVLMLWLEGGEKGYASPFWMTYRQAQALGGQVRGGSKATLIVKWVPRGTKDEEAGGEGRAGDGDRTIRRPFLKTYHVFNADQVDGLPAGFTREAGEPVDLGTRPDEGLDAYFARLGAAIETSPEPRAYYHPARDVIHMPPIGTFHTLEGYYETLGHEAVHWTGGPARLDRVTRYADRAAYAFEELVAEVGRCLLFARLGLTPSIDQSAAYVAGWLEALARDKKVIFRAASEAQRAVDLIVERCGTGAGPDGKPPAAAGHAPALEEAA